MTTPKQSKDVDSSQERTNLSAILKLYIAVNDIEQRSLSQELGMSESSLTRLLKGKSVDMKTFGNIVQWLTKEQT